MNAADRSFYVLVGLVAVPYVAMATLGCGLALYVGDRVVADGAASVTGPSWDVRLALGFLAVVAAGTAGSVWSLQRQWRATRHLVGGLAARRTAVHPEVDALAEPAGLDGRIDVVDAAEPFCVTYGLRAPRVAVSTALVDRITSEELDAVLAHERYHVRSNDPLKAVVTRALTRAFFFLPILAHLHRRYLAARELAADRRAVRAVGRTPLAGALVKITHGPDWSAATAAAAIGGDEHLALRVHQLEMGTEPPFHPLPRPAVWSSLAGLIGLVAALAAAVADAGGRDVVMGRASTLTGGWPTPLTVVLCGAMWAPVAWMTLRWARRRAWPRRTAIRRLQPTGEGR